MPDIASVLKAEIARLSRKETRALTGATRKASAQHRREIAELKRQVASLTKQVAFLTKQESRRVAKPTAESAPQGSRFSARGLRTHRGKLGLSADAYGALVGVSGQTIHNWENARTRPGAQQLSGVVAIRGLGKREALRRLEVLEG